MWGKLAWAPAESAVFAAGEPPPRRLMTSAYVEDVRALGRVLAERSVGRRAADRSTAMRRLAEVDLLSGRSEFETGFIAASG